MRSVNHFVLHEQIRKGLKLALTPEVGCTVAVIPWSHASKSRIRCAEFSFRYGDKSEVYAVVAAQTAYHFFASIQKLDRCLLGGVI
ncbi:MAG: hypothetical protein ACF788_08620 [Novipirellula sp. JB048]